MSYTPSDSLYEAMARADDAGPVLAEHPRDGEAGEEGWVRHGTGIELFAWTPTRVYRLQSFDSAADCWWESSPRNPPEERRASTVEGSDGR